MTNRMHRLRPTAPEAMALALLLTQLTPGCATGETYRSANSTTVIEQSGGGAPSRSTVTLYPDGQRIVTENGSSTDITVQRGAGAMEGHRWSSPFEPEDLDWMDQRFTPHGRFPGGSLPPWEQPASARAELRRQMLERVGLYGLL